MRESLSKIRLRGLVASGCAATTAALATTIHVSALKITLGIPIVLLAASAVGVHLRRLEVQILCRALWFSTALVATINLFLPLGVGRPLSLAMLAASIGALVSAGFSGLRGDAEVGAFRPVAFRTPLLLSVGMALADAHALLFYGLGLFERFGIVPLSLVLGPLLGVAAIGVYRLRTPAVFAMLLLNALVIGAVLAGALWVPPQLAVVLVVTSLVQLLLPLPMLRAILRRTREAESSSRVRVVDAIATGTHAPGARGDEVIAHDEEDGDRLEPAAASDFARSEAAR